MPSFLSSSGFGGHDRSIAGGGFKTAGEIPVQSFDETDRNGRAPETALLSTGLTNTANAYVNAGNHYLVRHYGLWLEVNANEAPHFLALDARVYRNSRPRYRVTEFVQAAVVPSTEGAFVNQYEAILDAEEELTGLAQGTF